MNLIQLMSRKGNFSYNIHLANLIGIVDAIFLQALIENCRHVDQTNAYIVTINDNITKTIQEQTALTSSQQTQSLNKLIELQFISQIDSDYRIQVDNLITFSQDIESISKLKLLSSKLDESIYKTKKKKTKQTAIKDTLMKSVGSTVPQVRDCFSQWIDSVLQKDGWMSSIAVQHAEEEFKRKFLNNASIIIQILKIASIHGWREIDWAIMEYQKTQVTNNPYQFSPQQYSQPVRNNLSSEVY